MIMKILLFLVFILPNSLVFGQYSNYEKGYKEGFGKGYCYNKSFGCIEQSPLFAPIPKINENSSNYQDGYNRGYAEGLDYSRRETQSQEIKNQRQTPINFRPYVSQIPVNDYRAIGVYKQKLYDERLNWIQTRCSKLVELHNELDNYDSKLRAEWSIPLGNWIISNENKNSDLADNNVFTQFSTYLNDYTERFTTVFNRVKDEILKNEINFDDRYSKSRPQYKKYADITFYENNQITYEINEMNEEGSHSKITSIDKNLLPDFIYNFDALKDGKSVKLFILYFKKYESYQYYFSDREIAVNERGIKSIAITNEYPQGGLGCPLFIKLSESSCLLFDQGKFLDCIYLGIMHYKLNKYHNGVFSETSYVYSPCWQEKKSGNKYYLNTHNIDNLKIFEDDLLINNNFNKIGF